jgi:hypothetical protein
MCLILAARPASAQMVYVRNAPPGATIEILMNARALPAATADASGDATLVVGLPTKQEEADVHIFTEACGNVRRLLLVERGLQPPASAQPCDRRDVYGFFVLRRVTTLVVDMERPDVAVFIRQGPVPPAWLAHGAEAEAAANRHLPPAPRGLMVSAGIGIATPSDFSTDACGDVTTCSVSDFKGNFSVGVSYWLKSWIGAQASFVKPGSASVTGSGDTFRFSTSRQLRYAQLGGMVGGAIGGVRIYGQGGATYHGATLTTSETSDDKTLTLADGTTQIVRGGTQSFELKTEGWGWYAGAGTEVWLKPAIAIYIDGGVAKLKGSALGTADGAMNDNVVTVMVGARIHLGR